MSFLISNHVGKLKMSPGHQLYASGGNGVPKQANRGSRQLVAGSNPHAEGGEEAASLRSRRQRTGRTTPSTSTAATLRRIQEVAKQVQQLAASPAIRQIQQMAEQVQ